MKLPQTCSSSSPTETTEECHLSLYLSLSLSLSNMLIFHGLGRLSAFARRRSYVLPKRNRSCLQHGATGLVQYCSCIEVFLCDFLIDYFTVLHRFFLFLFLLLFSLVLFVSFFVFSFLFFIFLYFFLNTCLILLANFIFFVYIKNFFIHV